MNLKLIIGFVFLLCYSILAQAQPAVGFNPHRPEVVLGESFSVDINLKRSGIIEGGGFDLRFDPEYVFIESVDLNTAVWRFSSSHGVIDNASGLVEDILFSSFEGAGNSTIATVTMHTLKAGKTQLSLTPSPLTPFARAGETVDVALHKARITIAEQ